MTRLLVSLFVLLYSGTLMAASAIVQTATGDVKATRGSGAPVAVAPNAPLESGTTITTGDNGKAILKFEDGQMIVLNSNTTFRISQYQYNQAKPEKSSMVFSLLKGALRSISGLIGKHNPAGFRLDTPVATIGIRGTDFMAVTGSLTLSIGQGTVTATNAATTTTFSAGQLGYIAEAGVAPTTITAAQLTSNAATSFAQLGNIPLPLGTGGAQGAANPSGYGSTTTGGTSAAGGSAATGGASGSLGATAGVAGAAGVAAAIALGTKQTTGTPVTATVTQ